MSDERLRKLANIIFDPTIGDAEAENAFSLARKQLKNYTYHPLLRNTENAEKATIKWIRVSYRIKQSIFETVTQIAFQHKIFLQIIIERTEQNTGSILDSVNLIFQYNGSSKNCRSFEQEMSNLLSQYNNILKTKTQLKPKPKKRKWFAW
jgi:hypothetical protein